MKSRTEFKIDFLLEREYDRALRFFLALIVACVIDFMMILWGIMVLGGERIALGEMDIIGYSFIFALVLVLGIVVVWIYLEKVYQEMFLPLEMAEKGRPVKRDFWGNIKEEQS